MRSSKLVDLDHDLTGTVFESATITVYTSLAEAESAWRQAVAHCACFLFQTFEWHAAWRDTVGRTETVTERIVHIADADGRTLLMLPLAISERRSLRVLEFLGGSLTDYNAPLIDSEFARVVDARDIRRLWRIIQRLLPNVDAVRLARMPKSIDGVRNPMTELARVQHTDDAYAAILPDSFKEFTATRSAQFFAQIRRHRRRLERRGSVDISFPAERDQRLEVVRVLARQKSDWLRSNGLADEFERPGTREFYERLTNCQLQAGKILVACLRVGDQTAAALWGAVFGRRYYFLLPSHAEEWRKFSAGRILTESVVQRCITQGDVRVFDLTVSHESYTHTWPDHALALHEYLEARTVKGIVFVSWRRLRNAIRSNRHTCALARAVLARLRMLLQGQPLRNEAGAQR